MRTTLYVNGKKISRKQLAAQIGEERVKRYIAESKAAYAIDPLEQSSYWLGGNNMLVIEFS